MGFLEHLDELRTRIIRSCIALGVGTLPGGSSAAMTYASCSIPLITCSSWRFEYVRASGISKIASTNNVIAR